MASRNAVVYVSCGATKSGLSAFLTISCFSLSQLIGSTLALRYLRAEYVAPLGATSLIFNFLFASILVGTPVTSTDIYGTIVVIVGVVGIVAFGSINSGLESGMDLSRLKYLWARAHWILLFVFKSVLLSLLFIFASQLERVRTARMDISAVPFSGQFSPRDVTSGQNSWWQRVRSSWDNLLNWIAMHLENWTASKDEKTLGWTLGIVWACCGGGLAGGCLVFARASVQLISGALSHENTGNQFVHVAAIATFVFLGITAVMQIICLNRGLRAYDSTLVVPVFYGVYTGTGFVDALVFNDEIDQYHSWTLFLIAVSILVLVSGVVLLTHKKPEPGARASTAGASHGSIALGSVPSTRKKDVSESRPEENEALREDVDGDPVVWDLGNASDDESDDATLAAHGDSRSSQDEHRDDKSKTGLAGTPGEEGRSLIQRNDEHEHDRDEW